MSKTTFFKTQISLYFLILIMLAVIPAVLILCIPLVSLDGSQAQKIGAYILAAGFWLSIILELLMTLICSSKRKKLEQQKTKDKALSKSKSGVISFFKTPEGKIADLAMIISFVAVIVIICMQVKSQWLILGCVSVLYLSFNMHCLLNGKNYRYIKLISNYKKEHGRDE